MDQSDYIETPNRYYVLMMRAIELAGSVQGATAPNPWVGAVISDGNSILGEGSTQPAGGEHAEIVALRQAGERARGSSLIVTLEPCCHHGRTGPCTDAIIAAGIKRVAVGITDPDLRVSGQGIAALRKAGIEVTEGICIDAVSDQLAPYIKVRTTGRPWVVLKLAMTSDGKIAAGDGSSQWITGEEARNDAHRLRAISDAVIVGAGTIRADDPRLTFRLDSFGLDWPQPLRVVLGRIEGAAKVRPALELSGDLVNILDELGNKGVIQVLVEGGAKVANRFHRAGLVDRYVFYVAPALFGGDEALGMFSGPGGSNMSQLWRGQFKTVQQLGDDIRIEIEPIVDSSNMDFENSSGKGVVAKPKISNSDGGPRD
ncbi:MAG TPA: bifunctional diaminohydroxyphosphoribosylaminopyrimidine deaminase/5-amino-6-(5-phosphoribosylamino)uracil reductase RibD [Acidimicrobiales bacterium]|nr:bifunctional diaminohydroxyphosphoribosylaminopyrimidine deaminase/5-amino-6-(5-phosphoribosylamino)uracil reductase RibD [Acidimicrobiales bacterium]